MTQKEAMLQQAAWLRQHIQDFGEDIPQDDPFAAGYMLGAFLAEQPELRFLVDTVIENAIIRSN